MMKKITAQLSLLAIILTGFLITGCFEEPTIEPVARPYSSVRVGNFSYNVDKFNVYVDDELKGSVNKNELLGSYFDLPSGSRHFVLTDDSGTEIYNDNVTITSYEEITLIFDGVYAPGVDTLHSFAPYPMTDGVVYLDETPDPGLVKILTTNVSPNTSTQNQKKYTIAYISSGFDSTVRSLYEYNKTETLNEAAGDYSFYVIEDTTDNPLAINPEYDTLSGPFNSTLTAGTRHYLFITGDPETPTLIFNSTPSLPVRSK
ncbi:MAG TPA: hypothetical protein PKA80_04020 [Ignavibacteriaceae bacterium]|nr:hypothetical protein [Ignavibacteriaceae bacterium]